MVCADDVSQAQTKEGASAPCALAHPHLKTWSTERAHWTPTGSTLPVQKDRLFGPAHKYLHRSISAVAAATEENKRRDLDDILVISLFFSSAHPIKAASHATPPSRFSARLLCFSVFFCTRHIDSTALSCAGHTDDLAQSPLSASSSWWQSSSASSPWSSSVSPISQSPSVSPSLSQQRANPMV